GGAVADEDIAGLPRIGSSGNRNTSPARAAATARQEVARYGAGELWKTGPELERAHDRADHSFRRRGDRGGPRDHVPQGAPRIFREQAVLPPGTVRGRLLFLAAGHR